MTHYARCIPSDFELDGPEGCANITVIIYVKTIYAEKNQSAQRRFAARHSRNADFESVVTGGQTRLSDRTGD